MPLGIKFIISISKSPYVEMILYYKYDERNWRFMLE